MEDIRSVLSNHSTRPPHTSDDPVHAEASAKPTTSEIPDVFFDEILVEFKLTRVEIIVLMALYRRTWCRPNLHRKHGISPLLDVNDLEESLQVDNNLYHQSIRKLETYGFLETIRSGQYFVRRYFTEKLDKKFSQSYDNFL